MYQTILVSIIYKILHYYMVLLLLTLTGCSSACTVNIEYVPRAGSHFEGYRNWAVGDTRLDWTGAEQGQGSHQGAAAQGSPMTWTSNAASSTGYVAENEYV